MENKKNEQQDIIDLGKIFTLLWSRKKTFVKVWIITFVLSCIWIFPQPRYYTCEVTLAPEATGETFGGGLSSIASSFGFDLSAGGTDAIYPLLYPDLMASNDFLVKLLRVEVENEEKDVKTDYYSYMAKHQKKNWLTRPFEQSFTYLKNLISKKKPGASYGVSEIDPFLLSEFDFNLLDKVKRNIKCSVDKKTDVIAITVQDQDRIICATLADSVRLLLQESITDYRTKKSRADMEHYRLLRDSAKAEYYKAIERYSNYSDANIQAIRQSSISEKDRLSNEVQLKQNTYTAMQTQFEAMKAKVQERTPAFTVLKSATVPIKPSGPKRVIFVAAMLILSTFVTAVVINTRSARNSY